MIAVIADDITGGAEIAGIGLRYGLKAVLSTRSDIPCPDADLWVVSTDSRSMCRESAFEVTVRTVDNLKSKGIEDVFKKTDSVLRGHIAAELIAQLKAESKQKVVFCPANPLSGRVIINGIYYIDGIPLHETGFSNDPDFLAKSSDVKEIIGPGFLCGIDIRIVDAVSETDLLNAISLKTQETILAGSAAFFTAFLEVNGYQSSAPKAAFPVLKNVLFVRGSAFAKSRKEVETTAAGGVPVNYLSPRIIDAPDYDRKLSDYADEVVAVLKKGKTAILAVGNPVLMGKEVAVKGMMAEVVSNILSTVKVNELIIEGGATTSSILKKINYTLFIPAFEYAPGVVRLKVCDNETMYLTIKPGSYQFPKSIWNIKNNN
jgi:uncharacterized protein YgbK (DUF1537 family)